ncbi:CRISPR-associated endonuclease Cas1 [Ectothiorhodospira lacustris]|uniref:CRISPR-associated endonuclease Cas1 n=1 Tax=Ectothiorhodospira lacustris TaxID=2899127 RepID=UPI001EE78A9E|nr:CRISPR-associated endonuclease Cas1 [Ectothiorhodospira lacustris]MCG5508759.1 CRISPR-associated endonuclease Cas1 [Ectothiorhodospira lacustris]MCG5520550.1 CRISPR-associated endonuclease Cas1 [Ectothiorhodospira lacustris]
METLYLTKDVKIAREHSTLVVIPAAGPRRRVPISGLKHVIVAGEAQLTTAVLGLCGRSEVRVTILDWHGNVTGTFEPKGSPAAGKVRVLQAAAFLDPERRLGFARAFVLGAARNIRANLKYRTYRGNHDIELQLSAIELLMGQIPTAGCVESLMGIEGQIRAYYYEAWARIDSRLDFGARRRRPPNNPLNCLISWFNGLAYSMVRNEIAKTHLDDCISFLHATREARSSLALDLAEIFKPAICDTIIFEAVLRNQMKPDWFHQEEGVCRLAEKGRAETLQLWVRKTEERVQGECSFREIVRQEALAIERDLLGLSEYRPWRRKI